MCDPMKGAERGVCNRKACSNEPAVHHNRITLMWYCTPCARRINDQCSLDKVEAFCSWPHGSTSVIILAGTVRDLILAHRPGETTTQQADEMRETLIGALSQELQEPSLAQASSVVLTVLGELDDWSAAAKFPKLATAVARLAKKEAA